MHVGRDERVRARTHLRAHTMRRYTSTRAQRVRARANACVRVNDSHRKKRARITCMITTGASTSARTRTTDLQEVAEFCGLPDSPSPSGFQPKGSPS